MTQDKENIDLESKRDLIRKSLILNMKNKGFCEKVISKRFNISEDEIERLFSDNKSNIKQSASNLYNNIFNRPEYVKIIEYKFSKTEKILDKDFPDHFPTETSSRLLELEVAYSIFKSENVEKIKQKGKSNKGCDFIIQLSKDCNLHIECVCPNTGKNHLNNLGREAEIEDGEEKIGELTAKTCTKVGYDKGYVSRFSSVIADKVEKIKNYNIPKEDIKILVVFDDFGGIMGSAKREFELTIADKIPEFIIYQNNNKISTEYVDAEPRRSFMKNNKLMSLESKKEEKGEIITQFDAYVYYDGFEKENKFLFYQVNEKISYLNEIRKIFQSKGLWND